MRQQGRRKSDRWMGPVFGILVLWRSFLAIYSNKNERWVVITRKALAASMFGWVIAGVNIFGALLFTVTALDADKEAVVISRGRFIPPVEARPLGEPDMKFLAGFASDVGGKNVKASVEPNGLTIRIARSEDFHQWLAILDSLPLAMPNVRLSLQGACLGGVDKAMEKTPDDCPVPAQAVVTGQIYTLKINP